MLRACLLLVLLGWASAQTVELVSRECLGCMCEASSNCDVGFGCVGDLCGPFKITRGYFLDSELHKEPAFAFQTYESCTRDPFCSAAVIRKYMAKYPRDCNKDGRRTCTDFAMLHQTGPGGCDANRLASRQTAYWRKLTSCLALYPGA
ncbi:lysozyme 1-like [Pollicipes pollicipes]|uniref:lysozyme 1-like n=1 Tax=Pollicipes pollicipes TaxID=41117 RepID=UPI0018856568|nr:lysozyme 1-like [Pollicipes pollicipes]